MAKLSRRDFMKTGLAAAGAAGVSRAPLPGSVKGATGGELATLIDTRKCIACGACVDACRYSNAEKFPEPEKPLPGMFPERVKVEDWSDKRDVRDRLTPYNWLYVDTVWVEHDGVEHEVNIPRRCMHCQNPPCADLCPFGAARKQNDGITRIDADICLGGAKCKIVCPWHVPQRQTGVGLYKKLPTTRFAGNGVMFKCDRCYDRLDEGGLPACIEECPEAVQKIGPRDRIMSEARRLAEEEGAYLYGMDENGGTNTVYVSAVPFEIINRALDKGPGRPHMDKVANAMDTEENLTMALLIAPFAGLAAAALRIFGFATPGGGKEEQDV
ncbi:MAG: 4Fe-4S dicluster domain-containing protein [Desulfatibacillaceae bacterium]